MVETGPKKKTSPPPGMLLINILPTSNKNIRYNCTLFQKKKSGGYEKQNQDYVCSSLTPMNVVKLSSNKKKRKKKKF